MTKFKLGLAAGVAALLAFGVAACGQTATTTEDAPAPVVEAAPADGAADATAPEAAVDPAAAPGTPGAAPAAPPAAPAAGQH